MISLEAIRDKAFELGWDDVGITEASIPDADIAAYKEWLKEGLHADLTYMENQLRTDPAALLTGAKSAIIFVSYYKQEKEAFSKDKGIIASYARGKDYHAIHRKRLKKFIVWLEEKASQKNICKGFSDSSLVLEKALAVKAGLGWFGKNTLLIHRKFGTFTLLSGLFTSLALPTTTALNLRLPRCGTCTRCLDACPTQAFISPYKLDAARCLSYHLIESKKTIPEEIAKKNPGYVFGCDICQDVCPHNIKKTTSATKDFSAQAGLGPYLNAEKLKVIQAHPEKLFGTPLQRRKSEGLAYNLRLLHLQNGIQELEF